MNARIRRTLGALAAALLVMLALAAPALAAPANDEIVNAEVLPEALPSATPGTTVEATGEPGEKVFGNEAKASVWYSWKASVAGPVVVDLCGPYSAGPQVSSGIGVYTGAGATWASLVKVNDTNGPCKLRFTAVAGTTYKIQVNTIFGESDFVIALHLPQPPANDNFAAAQVIAGLPLAVAGSTIEASFEAGEPDILGKSGGSRSVWFSWTAPVTAHVQLAGCPFETQRGSARNMAMGVYTGATLATLSKVVETNNCKVEFDAVNGVVYKIAYSGNFVGEGTFPLSLIEAPPPANDNFANAATIDPVLPQTISGDNGFATTETGENNLVIGGFKGISHSVWFQWTPAASGPVKLNVCGTDGRRLIGFFTGNTIATLVNMIPPQGFAPFCAADVEVVAGTTYRLAVAGTSSEGSAGPFTLNLHTISRPINDDFGSAQTIGPELPIGVDGDNTDGSLDVGEVSPAFFHDPIATVWYRWQSSITGPVDISTCGSATDVFAGVHTGPTLATLKPIAPRVDEAEPDESEEPGPCANPQEKGAQNRFMALAGTTYLIQVSSFEHGFEGPFRMTITDPNEKPKPASPGGGSGAGPAVAPPPPPRLDPIAQCRKSFPGKGRKARAKRAACIAKVKLKRAIAKCREGEKGAQRRKCIAAAHLRFEPDRPARRH